MVVPSMVGIMLGSFVGVRLLKVAKPTFIRWMVIGVLAFAGAKALQKGIWRPPTPADHVAGFVETGNETRASK